MNFTALKFEPHTILKAYAVLFGELPGGGMIFLDRKSLKRQWESRARTIAATQQRSSWSSSGAREDTLDFEELDWAYRSLVDLLDGRDQAMVAGWACESIDAVNAVLHKSRHLTQLKRVTRSAPVRSASAPARPASASARPASASARPASAPARPASAPVRMERSTPVAPRGTRTQTLDLPRVTVDAPGPRARLMFGRFLLSRGHITLQQLIDAVRWQRAQRPPVGRIAMNWGILSSNQVYEVLLAKDPDDRFCDVAVRKGYMTGFQRLAVLGRQREMQKPIGTYFVEQGILTREEVEGLAEEAHGQ